MYKNIYKSKNLKRENPEAFLKNKFFGGKSQLYVCSPAMFANIYYLEKEKAKRNNNSLYFINFEFEVINEKRNNEYYKDIIQDILSFSLRSSDLISWLADNQLALLLIDLEKSEVYKIIKRIENNFVDYGILKEINMTVKITDNNSHNNVMKF